MSIKSNVRATLCVLVALGWGASVEAADFLLTGDSAGQLQIGTGLPLPIGTAGIFQGGMTSVNGGTSCGDPVDGCPVGTDGPGTAYWPPLNVPVNPNISTGGAATRHISQNLSTGNGGAIVVPPGALSQSAPGGPPAAIGVFNTNVAVYQVATTITYSWPAATATFSPGGGPGIPGGATVVSLPQAGIGSIFYNGGPNAFGGAAQFAISPGPNAGLNKVPVNGTMIPIASVWINAGGKLPASGTKVGLVGASAMAGVAQPGAPIASPPAMTSFGVFSPANGRVNVTAAQLTPGGLMMFGFTCCTVGPNGTLANTTSPYMGSVVAPGPFLTNMATTTKGFPWTTGLITISASAAVPPEVFWQSGTDNRVAGVGNVSLVSGALSERMLSMANANRGWLSLPEPGALLGAGAALAALVLCHGLVRRRTH